MFCGVEGQFAQALDGMGRFRGEADPQGLERLFEELEDFGGELVCPQCFFLNILVFFGGLCLGVWDS